VRGELVTGNVPSVPEFSPTAGSSLGCMCGTMLSRDLAANRYSDLTPVILTRFRGWSGEEAAEDLVEELVREEALQVLHRGAARLGHRSKTTLELR
jgi:hypothetical protein